MSSPPVPVVSPPGPPQPLTLICTNCHGPLSGEYCAACGQRHEPHVHTLSHFAGEAFESISHADSRLWRTLGYLLTRPGYLTREFFAGRRVSYLPPFRLYLVISVVFFLVAGMPGAQPEAGSAALTNGKPIAAGTSVARAVIETDSGKEVFIPPEGFNDFCNEFKDQAKSTNEARNRLSAACRKVGEDHGRELGRAIVHNLPRAMFIFLPLLACIMKLMYWRPKRYYVEHLLFLIHNHAFVFLSAAMVMLVGMIPYVGEYDGWLQFAAILYAIWYIFRGMRVYYEQSRGRTLWKFFTLGFAYLIMGFVMFLLTALYSAITA